MFHGVELKIAGLFAQQLAKGEGFGAAGFDFAELVENATDIAQIDQTFQFLRQCWRQRREMRRCLRAHNEAEAAWQRRSARDTSSVVRGRSTASGGQGACRVQSEWCRAPMSAPVTTLPGDSSAASAWSRAEGSVGIGADLTG